MRADFVLVFIVFYDSVKRFFDGEHAIMQVTNRSFDLKNRPDSAKTKKYVTLTFALMITITFAVYTLKLFSMQVIEGSQYRKQSRTISQQVRVIPAQR